MRSVDRPVPTINTHRPAVEPFPAVLHIGVERQPEAVYTYDDMTAFYDDAEGDFTYDDDEPWPYDRFDLFCRFHGLEIEFDGPSIDGRFASAAVELTLDNRDGALTQYDSAGRLVDWIPGAHLDIWARYDGEDFWLFGGRVTAWRERADGTVEVEAFDAFSELNQNIADWLPGFTGQTANLRLGSIAIRAGYTGPRRFDVSDVPLLSVSSRRTPLEEMQLTAASDGGILFCDADGTLVYRDRFWPLGRDDQPGVAFFTDNWCAGAVVEVWEPVTTTDDDTLVNYAQLQNVAVPPIVVTATDDDSIANHGIHTVKGRRTTDLWQLETDGQALANYLVNHYADHYRRVEEFRLYVHDPRQTLWPVVLDLRIGDVVTWVHDQAAGAPDLLILDSIVVRIVHEIVPGSWVTTVGLSRTTENRVPGAYDITDWTYDEAGAVYVI